jgi:glycosyltransferase involved in cell wall biosynthesis
MSPAVSVVIALYNKANHIERAVRSVLAQSCPQFELIVVDDGSTDGGSVRVSTIKDSRLRLIRQQNGGVSAARNRGIKEASHEWVAFLDADDEWLPSFLELMMDLHRAFPDCGLLASTFVLSREEGLEDIQQRQLRYPSGWVGKLDNYYYDLLNPLFCSSCVVVKKELLMRIGGFPVYLNKGEDTNTWLRLYQETEFAFVNMVGAIYHLEAENRSVPRPSLIDGDPSKPYSHALILGQLLREKKIPLYKTQAAIEYMAANDLPVVQQLIEQGYRREAIVRLWSYRKTKIYRKRWNRLFVSSIVPSMIIHLYRRVRLQESVG